MVNLSKIIVVDVETSGLDANRHGVLEIGACELVGDLEFTSRVRLRWDLEWDPKAAEIHGLTEEDCRSARWPSEVEMYEEFCVWHRWRRFILAGQNPHLDLSMLRAIINRTPSREWPGLRSRLLDMHSVAMAYALREGLAVDAADLSTDAIYAMLGLPPEAKPHRALEGARRERQALRLMLGLEPPPSLQLVSPAELAGQTTASGLIEEIIATAPTFDLEKALSRGLRLSHSVYIPDDDDEEETQCECGLRFPSRFSTTTPDDCTLCPRCATSLQGEVIDVLRKTIRGEVLNSSAASMLEQVMQEDAR